MNDQERIQQLSDSLEKAKAQIKQLQEAKPDLVVPSVTANVGDAYVLQMNIRGYDELGREVMWNVRGKTLEEFDKVLTAKGERINKLQSIRPSKAEVPQARNGNGSTEETPICAIHKKPMSKVQGNKGAFWSCHEKLEDGSYCPYRPNKK